MSSAQFSPDGLRVVTTSGDKTARIWEAATGKPLATLQDHQDLVSSAQFSSDGLRVVTQSNEKTARVWHAGTGKLLATLRGHTNWVNSAEFSTDGLRVVTASDDTTARVWEAASGRLLATLEGHTDWVGNAQFSPDGLRVLTGSHDGTARVWEAASGKQLATLQGHTHWVICAQFSPDGLRVVTASDDKTARVWEAASGRSLATVQEHTIIPGDFGVSDRDYSAKFSPDGLRVATALFDPVPRVFESATGRLVAALQGHAAILQGHRAIVHSIQFRHDGLRIVTASDDGTARQWAILPASAGPPPEWFRDLLHYLAQKRLNADGEMEWVTTEDWLVLRQRLRTVLRESKSKEEPYLATLRLFVQPSPDE